MSKDIVIQEGGQGKNLTADKLRTALVGGGDCLWVPEDEVQLGEKSITENGTYLAADDGLYGYSQVTVSGIGSVTGIDPETGDEVEIHRDPETGEIVETVLPAEIRIITLPSKTTYERGETLDYSGIVVHCYSSSGEDMGEVPFNELVFPTRLANGGDEWTNGQGLNAIRLYYTLHYNMFDLPVYFSDRILGTDGYGYNATYGGGEPGSILLTRYNNYNYAASMTQHNAGMDMYSYAIAPSDWSQVTSGWVKSGASSGEILPGIFAALSYSQYLTDVPTSSVDPIGIDPATLQSLQSIPVQWPRYVDGAVLETSYDINVNDAEPI